jgi:hypothetical protein
MTADEIRELRSSIQAAASKTAWLEKEILLELCDLALRTYAGPAACPHGKLPPHCLTCHQSAGGAAAYDSVTVDARQIGKGTITNVPHSIGYVHDIGYVHEREEALQALLACPCVAHELAKVQSRYAHLQRDDSPQPHIPESQPSELERFALDTTQPNEKPENNG